VTLHYPKLIKFLIYSCKDKELAYDIAQDTMEAAWKYWKKIRSSEKLEAVLIKIAKNKLNRYYRKNPILISMEEIEIEEEADDETLEQIVGRIETSKELREMFRMLDEKYARVLILHYYYQLSLKEIEKMYGNEIKYKTVITWHNRALKKLKDVCIENNVTLLAI